MARKSKKQSKKRRSKIVPKESTSSENKEVVAGENKGGLKIENLEPPKQAKVKPGERLYVNAAKDTLYPEGHPKAASLYCTENKFVPRKEFESLKKGK